MHTPALYFSVFHLEADGGVMITASHNPAEDNGFKIVARPDARSTAPRSRSCASASRSARSAPAPRPGKASDHDILKDYVAYIANNIQLGPRRFKVVVDGGNGTGGVAGAADPEDAGRRRRRTSTAIRTAASPTTTPIRPCPRTSPI